MVCRCEQSELHHIGFRIYRYRIGGGYPAQNSTERDNRMTGIHFAMALIGAWRLTEVMGVDTIFAPIRGLFPKNKWIQLLWTCPKCLSVWSGIVCTAAFVFFPWFNWPFALSFTYLLANRIIENWLGQKPTKRGVFFEPSMEGIRVDWGGYDQRQAIEGIRNALAKMEVAEQVGQENR